MQGMMSIWIHSYSGDNGHSYSTEVTFDRQFTAAQSSFYEVDGDGLHACGIVGYRARPDVNGAEQVVTFGDWPNAQPFTYVDQCTAVTFGVTTGGHQEVRSLNNLFFW
jgi:hypothetical protein